MYGTYFGTFFLERNVFKDVQELINWRKANPRMLTNSMGLWIMILPTMQDALNAVGWKPLKVQRKETKSKQMFKIHNGMEPSCLVDIFTKKLDVTNYNLRGSSTSLQLPLPKTENEKRSFSYDGPKVWNSLPEHIRKAKSLNDFKSKIANCYFEFLNLVNYFT